MEFEEILRSFGRPYTKTSAKAWFDQLVRTHAADLTDLSAERADAFREWAVECWYEENWVHTRDEQHEGELVLFLNTLVDRYLKRRR